MIRVAILGPVESVTGVTTTRVNAIEVEDCAAIAFRMKSGALATSSITLGAADDTSRLRFCFEGLTAESGTEPYAPAKDDWSFRARWPVTQSAIDRVLAKVPQGKAGFAGFFEAMADALDKGGSRAVTADDGRRSIELVTAIYQAAREQRAVELPLGASNRFYEGWMPERHADPRVIEKAKRAARRRRGSCCHCAKGHRSASPNPSRLSAATPRDQKGP